MLLNSFQKRIFRPECNPSFESVHCIAHLDQDISEVLPYLNTALGGTQYLKNPPAVVFHAYGKIIKVDGREIAINALKDESEADRLLEWMKNEINETWENRDHISPSEKTPEEPKLFEILKRLPGTSCRKCGQPTCMVFASQVAEGGRDFAECPELDDEDRKALAEYLSGFNLDL